jgi:putative ABC transport system permease protein
MFLHYLKTGFRQLIRQKMYAAINIFGLAVGLTCSILIFLYVSDELSFDNFHRQENTIFRVLSRFHESDGSIRSRGPALPAALGEPLKDYFPEIRHIIRFAENRGVVRYGQNIARERVYFTDPPLFQVFSFPLAKGQPDTVLADRHSLVITEKASMRYFGKEDPLGKTMTLTFGQKTMDFTVTGVAKDTPRNSTIQFEFLIPIENLPALSYPEALTELGDFSYPLYIQLQPGANAQILSERLPVFVRQTFAAEFEKWQKEGEQKGDHIPVSLDLQRLQDMHLDPDSWDASDASSSYILAGIALIVLLIACVNFMNLSIGHAAARGRELGIRKVVGAQKRQLIVQFWGETLLIVFVAVCAGLGLSALFMPTFNLLAGKSLSIADLVSPGNVLILIGLLLFVSALAASYPAVVMSGVQPAKVLKGKLGMTNRRVLARALVLIQFALSIFLIISTLVFGKQTRFMTAKDTGYVREGLVSIDLQERVAEDSQKLLDLFRPKALSYNEVLQFGASNTSFGKGWSQFPLEKYGRRLNVFQFRVDEGFIPTMGIEVVQGRNFSQEYGSDSESAIVNRKFLEDLEISDPIGHRIGEFVQGPAQEYPYKLTIIGVMEDFHVQSMRYALSPAMLHMQPGWGMSNLLVRISSRSVMDTIHRLESIWKEVRPDKPFLYSFVDEDLEAQYSKEKKWTAIVKFSSLFAMIIACMGIFGLTSLAVSRRFKEIGIRKVLGANMAQIFSLVTKEFLVLVGAANLLSWPIAYFIMRRVLEGYHYRISIGPGFFLLAACLTLIVSLATVSYLAIKAAFFDPLQAIRYE